MKKFKVSEERVQMYLPKKQYEEGRALAKERGLSFAGLVREALAEYTRHQRLPVQGLTTHNPLNEIVGAFGDKEGKTDVSTRHDDYLADAVEARWKKSS